MSIKATRLRKSVIDSGKKIGLLVEKDGPTDQAIRRSSKAAATLVNDSEKQLKRLARGAQSTVDGLRAKLHAATAPRPGKK
jgi:hypothetical protein